jgi:vacuolar-type H+-ATPase subunit I/STV1
MKKLLLSLILGLFITPIFAQEIQDDIKIIQTLYGKEKRDLVGQYLSLTPEELAKFAPLYDAYEMERKEIGKQRIQVISEYVNSYGTADDKKIDELTMKVIKINQESDKLTAKYYAKVKKAVGSKNAAKFFQIESYLAMSIKMSIWDNIPFIDELDGVRN